MLVVRTKLNIIFRKCLFVFILFGAVIFLFHPGRFATSYDFIDTPQMWQYIVNVPLPENLSKPLCPLMPQPKIRSDGSSLLSLKFNLSEVRLGGRWHPSHCIPQHKIALIVPYRKREKHLSTFINYMHGFLQAQLIEYSIYVVEQTPKLAFNRGLLFNIGYTWALQKEQIPCFIFHDVDLLPETLENIYACTNKPRHMSSSVNTLRYKLPYVTLFGGVVAMLQAHFQMINGFPNRYFGWGGEDDDLFMRVLYKGMTIVRFSPSISRYYMLPHIKESGPAENLQHLQHVSDYLDHDGLNDLKQYCASVVENPKPLFMLITADLQLPLGYNQINSGDN